MPLMSLSRSRNMSAQYHTRFSPFDVNGVKEFCSIITSEVWSPIIWKQGLRTIANFDHCQWVALDFDDGLFTLQNALDTIKDFDLTAILGTTKSHQKEKISKSGKIQPACDRFRLVIPTASICRNSEVYEYNMRHFILMFGCDRSCKDSARFFYPCREIIYSCKGQTKVDWKPLPPNYKTNLERREERREELSQYPKGVLPRWIANLLKNGAPIGERHLTCYKLGANLSMMGYSLEEIYKMCMNSPLKDIGDHDVRRAIDNGAVAVRG
jgi:hypothetical protein